MADLNQFEEKSELFLRGELNPKEASEFQNQLDSDPLLKSEFELNNSIIDGIKQYRSAELKARLSAITISPFPVNFWAGVGSAAIIGGITATLIYQAVKDEPVELNDDSQARVEEVQGSAEETGDDYDISDDLQKEENVVENQNTPSQKQNTIVIQSPDSKEKNESLNEAVEEELIGDNASQTPAQVALPVGPKENSNIERSGEEGVSSVIREKSVNDKLDVDVKQHPEYSFHYQYSDHKLSIFGSFDKEPYRLLELDQNGKTSLYLAYDRKYYSLKDHTISPEPLKPIRDRNLLNNLRELDSGN